MSVASATTATVTKPACSTPLLPATCSLSIAQSSNPQKQQKLSASTSNTDRGDGHQLLLNLPQRRRALIIIGPQRRVVSDGELEVSAHFCPRRFLSELVLVFPDIADQMPALKAVASKNTIAANDRALIVLPLFQSTKHSLVAYGPVEAAEKDAKLEAALDLANKLKAAISKRDPSAWFDATDPASGYPVFGTQGPSFYPDVVGAEYLLGYETFSTGCCSMLSHPKWGANVYPSTMFAVTTTEVVRDAIADVFGSA